MKDYEKNEYTHLKGEYILPNNQPFLARIDGHTFSKFTKGFEKPYDINFSQAMIRTTSDLVEEFNARTGYTQSDEITLVFIPIQDSETGDWREWPFRGRVIKLASLLAGYASARFNWHLTHLIINEKKNQYSDSTMRKIMDGRAHFDSRLFSVPDLREVYNNISWRSSYDCRRNSISGLARQHFSSKQLHGKNSNEMKTMLLEKGIDYEQMPAEYRHGSFVKKEQYQLEATDQKTGKTVNAVRTRMKIFTHQLNGYSEEFAEVLSAKYL